jgi:hypothetical protein
MTNPTTPFSWQMPTATDLVTDLPADFEVFGQAVATSMADLLGGTTGQILSKASNTDMDFTWVTNDVGDITAVTAGTGISGGGTTGAVTVTNSMATAIDAKGDLIGGTGADTFARLAVGANGTVLTADSAEATGLKWAVPASGSTFVGCAVTRYDQSINSGTWTAITFTVEDYDTDGFHNNSTNTSRMTIPTGKGGKYQLTASGDFNGAGTGGTFRGIRLYKNGAVYESPTTGAVLRSIFANVDICTTTLDWTITLAATDYLEIYAFQDTGSAKNVNNNFFCITYLGA